MNFIYFPSFTSQLYFHGHDGFLSSGLVEARHSTQHLYFWPVPCWPPFHNIWHICLYQLQVVGYLIGTDSDGQPCVDYCLVPFGGQKLDLNSVLLYLNALGFGLGGALSLLISAYADFWGELPYEEIRRGVLII